MAGQSEIPWYHSDPRIGSSIADLLVRQGDIQAQRAQQVGNLWANAVGNVGNIAAGAVQQHQEQKQTRKREQAFSEAISSWDPADPRGSTMRLASVVGPQEAMKFGAGLMSFEAAIQKQAKGEVPTIDETKTALTAAAILNKNAPGMFDQQYGSLRATYGQAIKQHLGYDLPEAPTPEIKQGLMALGEQWGGGKAGTRQITVRNPDGSETVQIVEDKPGFSTTSAAPKEKSLADIQAEAAAKARGTASVRPPSDGKMYEVEVPGPAGTIVKKLVSEAEMRAGVTMAPKSVGNKPVTGAERQSLAYFNRAKQASDDIQSIEDKVSKSGLMAQGQLQYAPNILQTKEQQAYRQGQRAFTEARLRKESGAAIPPQEFENDSQTYFAQPGDSPETIEQKRKAREVVLQGLAFASGRAYEEYYGEPLPTPARPGAPPKGGAPKVGERRSFNGKIGEWDGKGWVEVK